jgi:hypothetical protein
MNSIVTNKGNALLAKGLTGIPIEFSKIALGDGNLGAIDPKELNDIISTRVESAVSSINLEGEGIASVSAAFSNEALEVGFYYRECGLFAIDPDEGEILYSYGNAAEYAEYIAPTGSSTLIEKVIKLVLTMGDAMNAIVELSSDVVSTREYVDVKIASDTVEKSLVSEENDFIVGSGVNAVARKSLTETKSILGIGTLNKLPTTAGVSPTFTATLTDFELLAGQRITVKFHAASAVASTLNINALGARSLKKPDGSNMTNIKAGVYTFVYDGANFIVQGEGASGNALASDLLSGKTADTDAGPIVGTIPIRAGTNASLANSAAATTITVRPPAGYYDGVDDVVTAVDADFIAANFLDTKNLYGLQGAIPSKGAQTYTPTETAQTIAAGQYLSGIQTITGVELASTSRMAHSSLPPVPNGAQYNKYILDAGLMVFLDGYTSYAAGKIIKKTYNAAGTLLATTDFVTGLATNNWNLVGYARRGVIYIGASDNTCKEYTHAGVLLGSYANYSARSSIRVANGKYINADYGGTVMQLKDIAGSIIASVNAPTDYSFMTTDNLIQISATTALFFGKYTPTGDPALFKITFSASAISISALIMDTGAFIALVSSLIGYNQSF